MTGTQPQLNYHYNPPSAQSTRQILESTSPTARSTSPSDPAVPFRPQTLARQKSNNYAEAEAEARSRAATQSASAQGAAEPQEDVVGGGESGTAGTGQKGGTVGTAGWRPKVGRQQSWNQQDLKRAMQMSAMAESREMEKAPGFSEGKKGNV